MNDIMDDKRKLMDREVLLRTLINKSRMGVVIIGQDHKVIEANDRFAEMLGYQPEELSQLHTWDWEADMTEAHIRHHFRDLSRINQYFETRHRRKDGTICEVEVSASGTSIGGSNAVICMCQDISARKQAERALKESEAKFRNFVENASDIIFTVDTAGLVTYASPNIERLSGYARSEVQGEVFSSFIHPDDLHIYKCFRDELFQRTVPQKVIEYRVKHKDGSWQWYSLSGSVSADENGEPVLICIARNSTEKKKYEEQLLFLSLHDQLTGLHNRNFFEKELKRLEESQQYPISILSCDLDDLKLINDTLGHPAGDRLLKICADLLERAMRGSDIVSRVGGDEFVAVLPGTTKAEAAAIVQRIYRSIESYNETKRDCPLSVSIGLATTSDAGVPLIEVLREADEEMYGVKNGKGIRSHRLVSDTIQ